MAQIGWIDFSTADRKKMSQAMSLIRPEGQLDELGIGRIRDGLADLLFPGISTIQTRAKYFFIVPYILRDYLYLSGKEKSKTTPLRYLEDKEHEAKNKLKARYSGQSNTGIIGITLSESRRSIRLPSEIYWVGLQTFGCLDTQGLAITGFLRNVGAQNKTLSNITKVDEMDDDRDAGIDFFHRIKVPAAPAGWLQNLDISLSADEAMFLKNAFTNPANFKLNKSVLQSVFKNPTLEILLTTEANFESFARKAIQINELPPSLLNNLILAHDFAVIAHGAHILYNHILQQHFFSANYQDEYLKDWEEWRAGLNDNMINYAGFEIATLSDWLSDAKYFISTWWDYVRNYEAEAMPHMINLIKNREIAVKGKKARLQNTLQTNAELSLHKWIGLRLLQYRFGNSKRIIQDIINSGS